MVTVLPVWPNSTRMAESDRQALRRRRGYWIALARKRQRLTLDALAELVGYGTGSGSIVSRWESGDRPVPSDRFGRLADVLDLPSDYLVEPPTTDEERLEDLALRRARADAEIADAEAAAAAARRPAERGPESEPARAPNGLPHQRSARPGPGEP